MSPHFRRKTTRISLNKGGLFELKPLHEDSIGSHMVSDFHGETDRMRLKAKKQRTVLYTKEVDDNDEDLIAMEVKDILKFTRE